MDVTSRIFVRNLPPSLKESEFKSHFSTKESITDVKLIPHRRIGYVGYKTPEAAAKAVKYFNKTFIRMSRIGVELAKSVDELQQVQNERAERNGHTRHEYDDRPGKRIRVEETAKDIENPRLKEYLDVMRPSAKSKTWANGDMAAESQPEDIIAKVPVTEDANGSDDEYEVVPKKRKLVSETAPMEQDIATIPTPPAEEEQPKVEAALVEPEEAPMSTEEVPLPASDADWMRSRTSRLLGLMDDDEIDARASGPEPSLVTTTAGAKVDRAAPEGVQAVPEPVLAPVREAAIDLVQNEGTASDEAPAATAAGTPSVQDTGRLFVRNLSYETKQDDLRGCFVTYGPVEEVHIPLDARTGQSKGFAYVQYTNIEDAVKAVEALDGKSFQGRLLHILPAAAKKENILDDYAIAKLPHKKQQQIRRKQEASSATFRWNTLYMNPDAVMSSIADRLGVSKSELLDPTSADAAVKQAHAETNVIQETKAYFSANGVDLDAFQRKEFHDRAILVKNFAYGTTPEDIRQLFEAHGTLTKLLMPPSGTIAIVEMEQPGQAHTAFRALAYRKFKESVLFLEKAPKAIFDAEVKTPTTVPKASATGKLSASDLLEKPDEPQNAVTSTLFVRNLNFTTSSAKLQETFKPLKGFLSAKVKTKTDPKRPGQVLSMGFGFVEFRSKEDAQSARAAMDGYRLEGHDLLVKESHKALDAAEERRKEDVAKKLAGRRTKIIVKNLPFEVTKKDVQKLFGPYGKLRTVRVPKKFDSSTRGFAFADFVTAREAENAMEALAGSHLLGRRLNLEFAAEETIDPEEEIERLSKKVGKQVDKVALQRLTGGGRKKFSAYEDGEDDVMD